MAKKVSRRRMRRRSPSGQRVRSGVGARRAASEAAGERASECATGGAAIIGSCESCGRGVAHDERRAEVFYDSIECWRVRVLLCPECSECRRDSNEIPPVPSVQVVEHLRLSREEMRHMDSLVDCEERLRRHRLRLTKEHPEDLRP